MQCNLLLFMLRWTIWWQIKSRRFLCRRLSKMIRYYYVGPFDTATKKSTFFEKKMLKLHDRIYRFLVARWQFEENYFVMIFIWQLFRQKGIRRNARERKARTQRCITCCLLKGEFVEWYLAVEWKLSERFIV